MLKKLLLIVWVSVVGLSISCKGPEGAVGPQGEKGETGATGATGPAGADTGGGSALILSSGADTTEADGSFIRGIPELSAEDEEFLGSSVVLVYIKAQGVYWPLPGVVSFAAGQQSNFTFYHGIEQKTFFVEIFQTDWSGTATAAPVRIVQDVRVVILPATTLRLNAAVNYNNYEETIASLGLTENNVRKIKKVTR